MRSCYFQGRKTVISSIKKVVALMLICSSAFGSTLTELMPSNELRAIEIVSDYAKKYQSADNELKKSAIWKQRTKALDKASTKQPGDKMGKWVGIIEKMGTTGDGNAFIVVRVSDIMTLSTWNNEFSDISDKTLIKFGSKEYETLMNLKTGSVIKFSFAIKLAGKGLTEKSRMTEPDFSTRFKDIEPISELQANK